MKDYEKDISFLNRFFIYKKTSTRNAEKLTKSLLDQLPDTIEFEQEGTLLAQEAVKKAEEIIKPKAKKLKDKLKLQNATEALEEESLKEESLKEESLKGEVEEILIIPKKKTTRRKKAVEFDIVDVDNV
jgi:hypothetical protein